MSLTTGVYTIRSAIEPNLFMGGRVPRGNQPKEVKIVNLPRPEERKEPHEWFIENRGKDKYFLRLKGAPAVVIRDEVYASFKENVRPEAWNIRRVPQGKNEYLILRDEKEDKDDKKKKNPRSGWKLPSGKPNTQVAIRNITGFQSFPPNFPASERFIIRSLADLD